MPNVYALILASQVNRRVLERRGPLAITRWSALGALAAGGAVLAAAWTGAGLAALAVALFLYVGSLGFVTPNTTALALEGQAARAGVASAVLGFVQAIVASAASAAVGALHDGSARPMGLVIAACATAAAALVLTSPTARG